MARLLALGDCVPAIDRLREQGHEVLRAPATARALGLAKDLAPELVLVGEGRDEDATVTLLATLVRDPSTRDLPLLVLRREAGGKAVRRYLETGARDVLLRETEPDELGARIESALRARQVLVELVAQRQRATLLELGGAVAHKLNQPLTGISVLVETLMAAHARGELSRERLSSRLLDLQRLVDRMAAIVKRVSRLVEYRTVGYVGDVRIIDLDDSSDSGGSRPGGG